MLPGHTGMVSGMTKLSQICKDHQGLQGQPGGQPAGHKPAVPWQQRWPVASWAVSTGAQSWGARDHLL